MALLLILDNNAQRNMANRPNDDYGAALKTIGRDSESGVNRMGGAIGSLLSRAPARGCVMRYLSSRRMTVSRARIDT